MAGHSNSGVTAICCLLHSLVPGGSTWQWIRLLARHVEHGGRATIVAELGPLAGPARAAGIEVVPTAWGDNGPRGRTWRKVAEHDVAIIHWEQRVLEVFPRALQACGRVALAVHVAPQTMTRRLAPPTPMRARRTLERAVAEPHAAVLVRGDAHRRKVANAYAVPEDALRILPASIPLPSLPFSPALGDPTEVLAMTRLAPDKTAIVRAAIELVRAGLGADHPCRLTIAGDGPWRPHAIALCEHHLPRDSWRIEGAPEDPIARLAASDLIVAQGTTTLEAAALGRRVVVARLLGAHGASGVVLTPDNYDQAARDPFGDPPVAEDPAQLWKELGALDESDLSVLRQLVESHNSLEVASRALGEALAATEA
ncbi:MAG TPA: glycosyltransferase [Solirubrobacterales bacterium]